MLAKTITAKSVDGVKEQIDLLIEDPNFKPTLALGYCHPGFEIESLLEYWKNTSIQLIGCSTGGEINNGEMSFDTISIMLFDMKPEAFKIFSEVYIDEDAFTAGKELAKKCNSAFDQHTMLIYSGGLTIDGGAVIDGVNSVVNDTTQVFGGLAGDNMKMERTFSFTHESVSDSMLIGCAFDNSSISINGMTYDGWNEMGRTHTVTKAEKNYLYEIDGLPAFDQFTKYFGDEMFKFKVGTENTFTFPGTYPLKISNPDGSVYVRSILQVNKKDKSLHLAGGIKVGSQFKFCPTPYMEVVDQTIHLFDDFAKSVPEPDAIILNSCAGRHYAFGPKMHKEVDGIYNIWKKPLVGYLSYGEYGKTGTSKSSQFQNVSCSLLTLTEK